MLLYFCLLLCTAFAEDVPVPEVESDLEIVVEASRDYQVYIAPVQYHIYDESVEAVIPHQMILNYTSKHAKNCKVKAGYSTWHNITQHGGMKVYDKSTIGYVWDNCNYGRDHRKCSVQNDHFFLETHVTVDENELTLSMTLFNSQLQPVNTTMTKNKKFVRWIKQQEVTVKVEESMMGSSTTIHKPKEELPLKWEIPHSLASELVYKASLGLWLGVKID